MKKLICCTLLILAGVFGLTGCAQAQEEQEETETVEEEQYLTVSYLTEDELESGCFYIQTTDEDGDTVYAELYAGESGDDLSSYGSGKVVWYDEYDQDAIPVMSDGDLLVYVCDSTFDESFVLEQYEDEGYTIGISGFYESDAGHIRLYVDSDYVYSGSDAQALLTDLEDLTVTIDTLTADDISEYGIITGLDEGVTYQMDVYVGTYLQTQGYQLTADSRAFVSTYYETLDEYYFMGGITACIVLPDDYESGYYSVGGQGLFYYDSDYVPDEGADTASEEILMTEEGWYTVRFFYGEGDAQPSARILSDGEIIAELEEDTSEVNMLTVSVSLDPGTYTLEIEGLEGVDYEYTVKAVS